MDQRAKEKLNHALRELNSISRELEDIASEMNSFKGIGMEKCTSKLFKISNKYRNAKAQLSMLD